METGVHGQQAAGTWLLRAALAGLLAAGLLLAPAWAGAMQGGSAPRLPPPEVFFGEPAIREFQLSPSGKNLALVVTTAGARTSLLVMGLDGSSETRRIAQYGDADILGVQWLDDDRLLFRLGDLTLGSGELLDQLGGLYTIRADGSGVRILISRNQSTDAPYRVLGWQHQLLHVPDRGAEGVHPDEVIVGRPLIENRRLAGMEPRWFNVVTGESRAMTVPEPPKRALAWWFDGHGRPRMLLTVAESESKEAVPERALYWLERPDGTWKSILRSKEVDMPYQPVAVDNEGTVYVVREADASGFTTLTRYDFEQQAPSAQPLLRTPGFDFAGSLVMEGRGGRLVGVRVDTDAEQTIWFDAAHRALQEEADRRWPGRMNRLQCRRCGTEESVALLLSASDRDPGQLLVYRARDKRWQHVASLRDQLKPELMGRLDLERIRARDGLELPVWVTRPAGLKPGRPAPAVVLVHGGPWVRGGSWQWRSMEQFLASRGYLVISPEFRGSTGYGRAHYQAGRGQWGQAMQDDVADALLWAQAQGLASDQACIAGASYGGYATLMGLVRHPQLYRCGIAWAAVSDLMLFVKGAWWLDDDVSAVGRRHLLPELVGDPKQDEERLQANSPVKLARQIRAPVLMGHGAEDQRVPEIHARRMRDALTDQGRTPQWVTYAKEGHSWQKTSTLVDFAQRMESFLLEHLGPGLPGPTAAPQPGPAP